MSDREGNVELLMLLCCLVGVVFFFSISLASLSLLFVPEDKSELIKKWQDMLKEKEEKEARARTIEEEKKELEKKIAEKQIYTEGKISESQRRKMEEELKRLNSEHDALRQRIEGLKKELAELALAPDSSKRQEKERELKELEKRYRELEKEIEEKSRILASREDLQASSFEESRKRLRAELNELQKKKKDLEGEINILKTRALIAGVSEFRNPLFIECRKDVYIFYPKKERVAVAELEEEGALKGRAKGHDIIVLLVRPEGFESFNKAYEKVKALGVKLSYEPIEADQKLDFLEGAKR